MADYSKKAEDYALYRPEYAPETWEEIAQIVGFHGASIVADIGSGTGNVAKHLVDRVRIVNAVEPCEEMRREAEKRLGGHPAFRSVDASAEETGLPTEGVDLIVVGQALHWFRPDAARREFRRILRPTGWLAVLWNDFGGTPEPDLAYYLHGFHSEISGKSDLALSLQREPPRRFRYPVRLRESWEHFLGGARSSANAPDIDAPDYPVFVEKTRRDFDSRARDGSIDIEYATVLVMGQLRNG